MEASAMPIGDDWANYSPPRSNVPTDRPRDLYEVLDCPKCGSEVWVSKSTLTRTADRGAPFRVYCKCGATIQGKYTP